jgi:hypothetical protein
MTGMTRNTDSSAYFVGTKKRVAWIIQDPDNLYEV